MPARHATISCLDCGQVYARLKAPKGKKPRQIRKGCCRDCFEKRQRAKKPKPDKSVFAEWRASPISGGLPTLGKRR